MNNYLTVHGTKSIEIKHDTANGVKWINIILRGADGKTTEVTAFDLDYSDIHMHTEITE
jgi:hypothetical protein